MPADISLLAKLQHLPHLEEFHLDQFYNHALTDPTWLLMRSTTNMLTDPDWFLMRSATNVLEKLSAKYWPRLRRLDLRFLTITVADFKAFVEPHAGKLKAFHMHGGLKCPKVSPEELVQRYYLPHWIRTVILPQGEGATFIHFLGLPGGSCEAEGQVSGSETGNSGVDDSEGGKV